MKPELESRVETAKGKLSDLKDASKEKWKETKEGMEEALGKLKDSIGRITSGDDEE